MLHLIWESFDQYGPSNLDGYQVASQQILYVVCTVSCVLVFVASNSRKKEW